ncbi:MerR family transcriptional regulator [Lacticaseibacillus chiayiensis]|uniref:MerR family transcriptional regulator n=1 Tax=Lacticaseibacillus chiayiensis TaxID=2100821 RepID=A0A4Q1TQR3_9LACO|nr:MerR family transcriptional regulator [Lacticaseibacillus chiayiensis]QVI34322.1 MerR family transcriptional regulator [Lacticaseibacillus chiayiensis]RXT20763.1 MerR family transcriptional regulator [Lacticaseibacillus chiayiensis]RXT58569.1 MerR family transcriptional regulator [Lacticaseibacillus chiayiensis]UYN56058.1 MerR family transcriptional regulator [Lacticaseibacillus chiayiensis]
MIYSTKQLANLAGVTVRTLRYYDKIGLLQPHRNPLNQYRVYTQTEVNRLQVIRFLQLFEMPLATIKNLLDGPTDQLTVALTRQRKQIMAKRDQLSLLLQTLDQTLEKGVDTMTDDEKFAAFKEQAINNNEQTFGKKIREQYGEDIVNASNEKFRKMSQAQVAKLTTLQQKILDELKPLVGTTDFNTPEAKHLFKLHKQFLQLTWPSEQYSPKAHRGLAAMYVSDPRFSKYYEDGTGKKGAAETLNAIIRHYTR